MRFALLAILALLLTSCGTKKKELHLFTWGNYIKPEILEAFAEEYNCNVVVDLYESNEAMYAKLLAGSRGYDLVFPSNYFLQLLQKQKLLKIIPKEKLPNLVHLDSKLLQKILPIEFDVAVPYMISFTGIGYRKDRISISDYSWNIFANSNYYKRMTMLNDMREVLGAALKYLGYSLNTHSQQELEKATALILQWKKNLAKFESEQYMNGIATREYLAVQGYSGQLLQVANEDANVGFFFPKEGIPISCDFVAIPEGALEVDLALAFINFLYRPEVALENMLFTMYLAPNKAAYALLPEELQQSSYLFPSDAMLQKSEVIQDVGAAITSYIQSWEKIKS
jgi:spermidine/putrescine transport system substrate-binding protein